jgi:hypothetical protein
MSISDYVWEFIDNSTYLLVIVACLAVTIGSVNLTVKLNAIAADVAVIRAVSETTPPAGCYCHGHPAKVATK